MNGIIDKVPEGQKNAQPMKYIAKITGASEREVREAVKDSRAAGILICSGNRGYWKPETLDETREYVSHQISRIRTGKKVLQPFLDAIEEAERGERG